MDDACQSQRACFQMLEEHQRTGCSDILIRLSQVTRLNFSYMPDGFENISGSELNKGDDNGDEEEEACAEIQKQDPDSEAINSAEAGDKAREGEGLAAVRTGVPTERGQRRCASWCLLLGRWSR